MTASDIAALALCQLDPRWDYLNEQQRAIWLKNSRSGKAYRAAKRAAEITLKYAATQAPSTATMDSAVAGETPRAAKEVPVHGTHSRQSAMPNQRGYLGTDAAGTVDDADQCAHDWRRVEVGYESAPGYECDKCGEQRAKLW